MAYRRPRQVLRSRSSARPVRRERGCDAVMARGPARAGRSGTSAGGEGRAGARAWPGRAAAAGARLRGVPHRPARHRGGPAGAPARSDAGPRGGRRGGRDRAGQRGRLRHRRPGRGGLAALHRRHLPLLRARRGEPLPVVRIHRLGRGRRLCRVPDCSRGVRAPAAARGTPTSSSRRCCARASSATARSSAPPCRPAAGSASTASAAAPTWRRRSPSRSAPRCP